MSDEGARDKKEIKKMKKCLSGIIELIPKGKNENMLTKADLMESFRLWESNLEMTEVLLSWQTKRPSLMLDTYEQQSGECWAIAVSRAIAIMMKMKNLDENLHPTAVELINGVGTHKLSSDFEIGDMSDAIPFVTSNYVDEMNIRRRPQLGNEQQNEEFEKCIIRLLTKGPLAICFEYLPSYRAYQGTGTYVPTDLDFHLRVLERLPKHCVLLMGVGVEMRDGKAIEFWEVQENFGAYFGPRMGYTRFARHMCLIKEVYELGELIVR